MLIGAQPLASGPLAAALGSTYEPIYVVRGQSYLARVRVLVDGEDVAAMVTGDLDVDREEGAAAVAGFVLLLPPGPVDTRAWKGKSVVIDYISRDRYGVFTEARLFTGWLKMPTWEPTWRLLACECSDRLQQRVEGMSFEAIDAMTGGYWSADLFEPVEGRSRWDYAQERMKSRAASLDCSVHGEVRVTNWAKASVPHFVFGLGTTEHESVQLDEADMDDVTNRLEIDAGYRFPRLWQHVQGFGWEHPQYTGSGIPGFCAWRPWTSDLPTTEMIEDAITGAGLTLVGNVGGYKLPLSANDPCGDGVAWTNTFDNLWLSANANGARRWVQQVTERYTLLLTAPGGEDEATQVIARDSGNVAIESAQADEWEDGRPTGGGSVTDLVDEMRRNSALLTLLWGGAVELLSAHRGTTLSWQVPTDLALGVDLVHTLRLEDRALAQGKCRRIQHQIDIEGGTAITTISVAISRGGGVGDPLNVPPRPDTSLPDIGGSDPTLPTQLGGRLNDPITGAPIPPYDDERLGFSGNWDAKDDLTAEDFPRRFKVEAVEIPEIYRDERTGELTAHYRVAIPNDLLEL